MNSETIGKQIWQEYNSKEGTQKKIRFLKKKKE